MKEMLEKRIFDLENILKNSSKKETIEILIDLNKSIFLKRYGYEYISKKEVLH